MPFAALGLEPRLLAAIKDAGYTEPTPIQSAAIPKILTGGDVIGIAQTGTVKDLLGNVAPTGPIGNFVVVA